MEQKQTFKTKQLRMVIQISAITKYFDDQKSGTNTIIPKDTTEYEVEKEKIYWYNLVNSLLNANNLFNGIEDTLDLLFYKKQIDTNIKYQKTKETLQNDLVSFKAYISETFLNDFETIKTFTHIKNINEFIIENNKNKKINIDEKINGLLSVIVSHEEYEVVAQRLKVYIPCDNILIKPQGLKNLYDIKIEEWKKDMSEKLVSLEDLLENFCVKSDLEILRNLLNVYSKETVYEKINEIELKIASMDEKIDKQTVDINLLKEQVTVMIDDINLLKGQSTVMIGDIDDLKTKVYGLPGGV